MDKVTKEQRSLIMSKITGKNTKPEKIVFNRLKSLGYKFKKHYKLLGFFPDIVFKEDKVVVFIDGVFWHGKNFKKDKKKLSPFWINKIRKNIRRDKKYRIQLEKEGWKVIRLWEDEIGRDIDRCIQKIIESLSPNI